MDINGILESSVNKRIIDEMYGTKFSVAEGNAYIIRRGQTPSQQNAGNFFDVATDSAREYLPITINIPKLRDGGFKEEENSKTSTEGFQAFVRNCTEIKQNDMILYDGNIYSVRDLFTQKWGKTKNETLYQKFRMLFVQKSNDIPAVSYPTA